MAQVNQSLLEQYHKAQLQNWINNNVNNNDISFKTIFRGSEQQHTPAAFHASCDNKGPTVVIIRTSRGLFGGYVSASWDSSNAQIQDPTAFLFQLDPSPRKYPVVAGQVAIHKNPNTGPIFGTSDLIIYQAGGVPGVTSISSTLAASYPFAAIAGSVLQANTALAGMVPPYGVADVEVLQVLPCAVGPEMPLITHASIDFTADGVHQLRSNVISWVPSNIETVGIGKAVLLLAGALGAGKSATISSSATSLSESRGIRHIAASRTSLTSVTKRLAGFDFTKLRNESRDTVLAHIMMLDTAGWGGANYPGLDLVLDGRVPTNNTMAVGDATLFSSRAPEIRPELSVTFADAVHGVVYVVPHAQLANLTTYCQNMNILHDSVLERGLAVVAVITGIDADETVRRKGLKAAYASEELHDARRRVATELRINPGQVYLVKNYQEESQPTLEVDGLTLFFLQGVQQQVDSMLDRISLGLQHIPNLPTHVKNKNNKM